MNVATTKVTRDLVGCPYFDTDSDVCMASFRAVKLEKLLRQYRCGSNNYDNCVLFMAKRLRRGL